MQQNERLVSMLSNLDLSQIRASLKTLTSADTEPETSHQEKEVVPSKHGSGLRRSREAAAPESKRLALLSASKASERLQRSYTKKSQLELEVKAYQ